MNFEEFIKTEDFEQFSNWGNFMDSNNLKKFINLIKQFDSYEKFYEFMTLMKSIPTISQITKLTHTDSNLFIFEYLQSQGYFNLLDSTQKYYLFVEACEYESINIAMLIFSNSIDLEKVKIFMKNFLTQFGNNSEYIIFKKIWEKNIIIFNQKEIEEIFFSILKSTNIEFIEWFYSLNLINLKDEKISEQINFKILMNASNSDDYKVAIFICTQFLYLKN